jgi:SAM-dependent methyltransferase
MQPQREGIARYWDRAGHGPMRPTVALALEKFVAEQRFPLHIVDLGCGVGRDTLPLLAMGHRVQAVDKEEAALARLAQDCPSEDQSRLTCIIGRFEDVNWTEVDLVVSSFALPFCPPDRFVDLWEKIHMSLTVDGRIACQLLGPNDDFVGRRGVTTHTQEEVRQLTTGYDVELLREEEADTVTPRGRPKHWHLFHLVLRKA